MQQLFSGYICITPGQRQIKACDAISPAEQLYVILKQALLIFILHLQYISFQKKIKSICL
jgi:hypothetical protein